jgi:hypothetical protein
MVSAEEIINDAASILKTLIKTELIGSGIGGLETFK